MTIGMREVAELAGSGMLPLLGTGSTRKVYRADDVVYKVDIPWVGYDSGNALEARAINHFKSLNLPPNIGVPDYTLWDDVLAMPYIDGIVTGCLPLEIETLLTNLGHYDLCEGNVILSNGVYWLVDLGITLD